MGGTGGLGRSCAVAFVVALVGCATGGTGDYGAGTGGGTGGDGREGGAGGGDSAAGGPHEGGAGPANDAGSGSSGGSGSGGSSSGGSGSGGSSGSGSGSGGAVDSGGGGSCTAVAVSPAEPTSGGPRCSGGGACTARDMTAYTPSWVPPLGPHAAKCTAQQTSDFYDACLGPNGSGSACDAWTTAAPNTACDACLETQHTASGFGALVEAGGIVYANIPGCVALVEPCNQPCAQAVQALVQCDLGACDPVSACLTQSAYDSCRTAAESGTCACGSFVAPADCLGAVATAGHPAFAACLGSQTSGDFQTVFTAVATVICGP